MGKTWGRTGNVDEEYRAWGFTEVKTESLQTKSMILNDVFHIGNA